MTTPNENVSMALFCDFENVALGVRDTKYQKFDIRPVLERLLLKGSIVVKKAYCDWERYKEFKAPMHEANFELIEIPHVRQSGKNSADIRLVVDALDFCYTKSHVNTFVIISGDSDFSPLVSKLRENNKKVIGVGVKQSTSDLLIANCDEFIFYDDLAREGQRTADARRDNRGGASTGQRRTPDEELRRKEELEARKTQAVDMVVETFEALMAERGDSGKIWASALKDALKRRKPDFNESYYGFRAFGNLLDEAQSRGFLDVGREEKSGTYVYRDSIDGTPEVNRAGGQGRSRSGQGRQSAQAAQVDVDDTQAGAEQEETGSRPARRSRGGRKSGGSGRGANHAVEQGAGEVAVAAPSDAAPDAQAAVPVAAPEGVQDRGQERTRERTRERRTQERTQEGAFTPATAPATAPATTAATAPATTPPVSFQGAAQAERQANQQAQVDKQAEADEETAKALAREVAKLESMRADALARAQAPKPVQPSRLPPMPTPLPQARQPLPAVNIAEWTFVEPPAETRRDAADKAPAKVADPFAGASARPAAEPAPAPAPAAPAKRARAASKTTKAKSAESDAGRAARAVTTEPVATKSTATGATATKPTATKPSATKSSATEAAATGSAASAPAAEPQAEASAKPARKTASRTRSPRKTPAKES
ncbi:MULTISPECIES: NYN domain-containing protein [Achromobacter]|uniref:NYN domain-containing protein n=1 Tax=Achromobacter spanius TaxID=217203 RepID=A0ABY8GXK0_9BURK|nr:MULTISPECIES: NYN domain-containing protein [Achromobacter]WAI81156.1 NYN domain-containing protein [Achromobacter spanius]WEX96674.1 NYN domain-containing protein [Achromobacter sp. SS2-2022]WFP09610.1 NYN domain-containing protein [Achromobacter spanius]